MNKKNIIYVGFLVVCLIGITAAFLTSKTFTQLAIGTILYPLLVFFAFKHFPVNPRKVQTKKPAVVIQSVNESKKEAVAIADIDKRAFLKLIGGVGISYFLLSIFTRKVEGLLGKSPDTGAAVLEDKTGEQINPAERQPTDGYKITEVDSGEITFYGFVNNKGAWYIMKEDPNTGSFRYARSESNFSGNWDGRERLKYDYFHNVFFSP
jgi:hypothetical protein